MKTKEHYTGKKTEQQSTHRKTSQLTSLYRQLVVYSGKENSWTEYLSVWDVSHVFWVYWQFSSSCQDWKVLAWKWRAGYILFCLTYLQNRQPSCDARIFTVTGDSWYACKQQRENILIFKLSGWLNSWCWHLKNLALTYKRNKLIQKPKTE